MTADSNLVSLKIVHKVGIITIERKEKLNCLNLKIVNELIVKLNAIENNPEIDWVLIRGQGDKGFCAGGDVVDVIRQVEAGASEDFFFKKEYELDLKIHKFDKPIAVYAHGITMGGGLGLLAGADLKITNSKCKMAMPEVTIGFFPDVGANYFLDHLPMSLKLFLGMTGTVFERDLALEMKIVDYVIEENELNNILETPHSFVDFKNRLEEFHISPQLDISLDEICSEVSSLEKIVSFNEVISYAKKLSESSENIWLKESFKKMLKGSPISTFVTWHYFKLEHEKKIDEILNFDLLLGQEFVRNSDFKEGVRALLIDKDNDPHWRVSFEEVEKSEEIANILKPLLSIS